MRLLSDQLAAWIAAPALLPRHAGLLPACTVPMTPSDHAHLLHGGSGAIGHAVLAHRHVQDPGWIERAVRIDRLTAEVAGEAGRRDAYLSLNRFHGRRRIDNLAQLAALAVDLDFYTLPALERLPAAIIAAQACDDLEDARLPLPTIAFDSGRGVCLVWLHQPTPAAALPRWNACQKELWAVLAHLGADRNALDAARVFRIAGSVNAKSGRVVAPIFKVERAPWSFDELAYEILRESRSGYAERIQRERTLRAERQRRKTGAAPASGHRFSGASLWALRLQELERLIAHRHWGTLPPGQRDVWLLHLCIGMSWTMDPATARAEITRLARRYAGWSDRETASRMSAILHRHKASFDGVRRPQGKDGKRDGKSGDDPRYRLRRTSIVEALGITRHEMETCGLRALVDDDLKRLHDRKGAEDRRRMAGAVPRDSYCSKAAQRAGMARAWRAQGLSWQDVAERMKLPSPDAARKLAARAA
jgi:hypothetical protein